MSSRFSGYIQPIVIARGASHEAAVVAVARASVAAWLDAPAATTWEPWLGASFAKTVRRTKPGHLASLQEYLPTRVAVDDPADPTGLSPAIALAGVPVLSDEMPGPVAKTQVSGTDFDRCGTWPGLPDGAADFTGRVPWLTVNLGAQMTTGKTAAQVAHSLFGWALGLDAASLTLWREQGMPMLCRELDRDRFDRAVRDRPSGAVLIQDSGYTEVAPGTATVLAHDQQAATCR